MPTFAYMAMTITGVMHVISGILIFICCCAGYGLVYRGLDAPDEYDNEFPDFDQIRINLGAVMGASIWIIMVGTLGILTGGKYRQRNTTNGLKIAYMVTSILSAVFFTHVGIGLSYVIFLGHHIKIIGIVGSLLSFANFVLSIVSASICCCCSESTTTTTGFVYVQENQGNYFPQNYPIENDPSGAHPSANYIPGTYPPPSYSFNDQYAGPQPPRQGFINPGYQPNPILPSEFQKNGAA